MKDETVGLKRSSSVGGREDDGDVDGAGVNGLVSWRFEAIDAYQPSGGSHAHRMIRDPVDILRVGRLTVDPEDGAYILDGIAKLLARTCCCREQRIACAWHASEFTSRSTD